MAFDETIFVAMALFFGNVSIMFCGMKTGIWPGEGSAVIRGQSHENVDAGTAPLKPLPRVSTSRADGACLWESDAELFDLMRRELFTAVVGDVLDAVERMRQFLPPEIRPLDVTMVVAGRAMPVLEADCFEQAVRVEDCKRPFGLMFEALDDLKAGEVYICTGSSPCYALWGELMTLRAQKLGAAGAILHGYSRDTRGVMKLGFPVFSMGAYSQDQGVRGRVIDYRCRIAFANGAEVNPGDLVFGDRDGVVIVPRQIESEIILAALEKVRGENRVRKAIKNGMSARDAYDTYGIM